MARSDTIAQDKWRVQVVRPDGTVSHESLFADELMANNYYGSLDIGGSLARIQVRRAWCRLFSTIKEKRM